MKKLFTLLLIAATPVAAMAQSATFSVGLRGGVSSMTRMDNRFHGEGKTVACTNELFGRYQTKNGLAFEGAVGYGHYKSGVAAYPEQWPIGAPVFENQWQPMPKEWARNEQYRRSDYQFTGRVQFALPSGPGCCHGHSCGPAGLKPRFRSYVGLAASYLASSFAFQGDLYNENGRVGDYAKTTKTGNFWAGLSNTIVLDVCPRVQVSGGAQWMANLSGDAGFFSDPVSRRRDYLYSQRPSSQLLFQLGAGFKL